MGNGATGGHKVGEKEDPFGSCVPLSTQAAHRRTIRMSTQVLPPRLLREYMHTTHTTTLYSSVSCLARGVSSAIHPANFL